MKQKPRISFIYNADSGIFNTVSDIAHKIFSPETYSCNLCAITYGTFSIREEWKQYLESLDAELEFLHRDEALKKFGDASIELPAILLQCGNCVEILITAAEINQCRTVSDLKLLITERLAACCG